MCNNFEETMTKFELRQRARIWRETLKEVGVLFLTLRLKGYAVYRAYNGNWAVVTDGTNLCHTRWNYRQGIVIERAFRPTHTPTKNGVWDYRVQPQPGPGGLVKTVVWALEGPTPEGRQGYLDFEEYKSHLKKWCDLRKLQFPLKLR